MLNNLNTPILIVSAIAAAFFVAVWFSLVIWTARDIKSRSRDPLLRILSIAAVIVLNLIGYIMYLILRPKYTIAELFQQSLEEEALLQSLESPSRCPDCGKSVKKHWQHCPYCGVILTTRCAVCNSTMELNWEYCPHCGNSRTEPAENATLIEDSAMLPDNSENHPLPSSNEELIEDNDFEQI